MKRKLEDAPLHPRLNVSEIAGRLKRMRTDYKLTQEVVAEMFGITRSGYAVMESGKHYISIPYLVLLQDFYTKRYGDYRSLEWFVFGNDPALISQTEVQKELETIKRELALLKENNFLLRKMLDMKQHTVEK